MVLQILTPSYLLGVQPFCCTFICRHLFPSSEPVRTILCEKEKQLVTLAKGDLYSDIQQRKKKQKKQWEQSSVSLMWLRRARLVVGKPALNSPKNEPGSVCFLELIWR